MVSAKDRQPIDGRPVLALPSCRWTARARARAASRATCRRGGRSWRTLGLLRATARGLAALEEVGRQRQVAGAAPKSLESAMRARSATLNRRQSRRFRGSPPAGTRPRVGGRRRLIGLDSVWAVPALSGEGDLDALARRRRLARVSAEAPARPDDGEIGPLPSVQARRYPCRHRWNRPSCRRVRSGASPVFR